MSCSFSQEYHQRLLIIDHYNKHGRNEKVLKYYENYKMQILLEKMALIDSLDAGLLQAFNL